MSWFGRLGEFGPLRRVIGFVSVQSVLLRLVLLVLGVVFSTRSIGEAVIGM